MADDDTKPDTPVGETVEHPEKAKPTEETPPPVDKPENRESDVKGLIDGLTDKVNELEQKITAIVDSGGERDSVPGGRRPWTHKRMFR